MSLFDRFHLPWQSIRYAATALAVLVVTTAVASKAPVRKSQIDQATRASALEAQFGSLPATTTDAREGLAPLPLTAGEQAKFARARAAVEAAEAAGTRWIEPEPEQVEVATEADAEQMWESFRKQEPKARTWTPGVPANQQGGGQ